MANVLISYISKQLDAIQKQELWMGQNFEEKFSQITAEEAFISYQEDMHSVAQIVAHLTAWKKDALLKVNEGRGKLTDDHNENWPSNEELKIKGWETIKKEFEISHKDLMEALSGHNDELLELTYHDQDYKKEYEMAFMLEGLIHHDVYHLGQIGLVIKMIKK